MIRGLASHNPSVFGYRLVVAISLIAGAGGGGGVLGFGLDRGYRVAGAVPRGRLREVPERFRPHLEEIAGGLPDCMRRHVETADAILILEPESRANAALRSLCGDLRKPHLVVDPRDRETTEVARAWLARLSGVERLHVVATQAGNDRRPVAGVLERALWPRSVTIAVAAAPAGARHLALARLRFVDKSGQVHTRAVEEMVEGTVADAEAHAAALGLAELKVPSAVWVVSASVVKAYCAPSARNRVRWVRPMDEATAELLRSAQVLAAGLASGRSSPPPSPGMPSPA